jgi:post-segregation antitoxin (ccd killing protein)
MLYFCLKNNVNMTLIQLRIPDDLNNEIRKVTIDVENFVIGAIQHELERTRSATDLEIEAASIVDQSDDLLTADELKYYLNLADYV